MAESSDMKREPKSPLSEYELPSGGGHRQRKALSSSPGDLHAKTTCPNCKNPITGLTSNFSPTDTTDNGSDCLLKDSSTLGMDRKTGSTGPSLLAPSLFNATCPVLSPRSASHLYRRSPSIEELLIRYAPKHILKSYLQQKRGENEITSSDKSHLMQQLLLNGVKYAYTPLFSGQPSKSQHCSTVIADNDVKKTSCNVTQCTRFLPRNPTNGVSEGVKDDCRVVNNGSQSIIYKTNSFTDLTSLYCEAHESSHKKSKSLTDLASVHEDKKYANFHIGHSAEDNCEPCQCPGTKTRPWSQTHYASQENQTADVLYCQSKEEKDDSTVPEIVEDWHKACIKPNQTNTSSEWSISGDRIPRKTLCASQTPSFTLLIPEPPSVVISDHSETYDMSHCGVDPHLPSNISPNANYHTLSNPVFERKCSSSSISSEHSSDSFRSYAMSDSSYSIDDDDSDFACEPQPRKTCKGSWRKIRNMVHWSPFIQQFKKHKYPWVQLAGHQGNFQAGEQGTILKKYSAQESKCLQQLMTDILRPYAPEYKGTIEQDGELYIQMQDLLCEFESPSVMDIKLGTRTYLEEELEKARKNPKPRKDMYKKMTEVNPDEPSAEERKQGAITKPRYMIWRETLSSTSNLGFRIEGIKKKDVHSTNYKTTKSRKEVKDVLNYFTEGDASILMCYLRRLKAVRATLESSPFFSSHEVIGSSLLFVHDQLGSASIWMIDFGKTTSLGGNRTLTHREPWREGNREDGYLTGLDSLVDIFSELLQENRTGLQHN